MIEGALVVRVFLYGLMLLVPDYGLDGTRNTGKDDQLFVLLPDARFGADGIEKHNPHLFYCKQYNGSGECTSAGGWLLAEDELFEELEFYWVSSDGSSQWVPTGGVIWSDEMADRPDGVYRFPPSRRPEMRKDFDWSVRLGDVLGTQYRVSPRKECLLGTAMECKELVARMKLEGGEIQTCSFVKMKDKSHVPVVRFPWSGYPAHAMAQSMVLELRESLGNVKGIRIEGSSGREEEIVAKGPIGRSCGDDEEDWCVDLALTNLSPKKGWVNRGDHYRRYYRLLDISPTPRHLPVPVVESSAETKPKGHVDPECSNPFGDLTVAIFGAEKKADLRTTEDRAICPVGTP